MAILKVIAICIAISMGVIFAYSIILDLYLKYFDDQNKQ